MPLLPFASSLIGGFVKKIGDTMSGMLTIAATLGSGDQNVAGFFNSNGNGYLTMGTSNTSSHAALFIYDNTTGYAALRVLGDAAGTGVNVFNGGNVSIGSTTNPSAPLGISRALGSGDKLVFSAFNTSGNGYLLIGTSNVASHAMLFIYDDSSNYGAFRVLGDAAGTGVNVLDGGNVGIGTLTATAVLQLKAGSTGANGAPLKFTSGSNLTTPEAGTYEYDGNNHYVTKATAIRESISTVLFTQTADKAVSNTVTETSIIGTGVGTLTLPANFFVVGKTIRLRIGGIYSTPIASTPSIVIKVKHGTTVIATVTTSGLLAGATNLEFDGEIAITCRSVGASGSVVVHGDIEYATGVAGTISVDPLNNAGVATTIDTTASKLLDVTVTWDTATSTRSVTSIVTLGEIIN